MSVEQHHQQQQELETQGALWEHPPAATGTPPAATGLDGQAQHVQLHNIPCQERPYSSAASTAISAQLPPDLAQAAAVNAAVEQRVAAWVENKLIPAINSQVSCCCCPELLHLQHAQDVSRASVWQRLSIFEHAKSTACLHHWACFKALQTDRHQECPLAPSAPLLCAGVACVGHPQCPGSSAGRCGHHRGCCWSQGCLCC